MLLLDNDFDQKWGSATTVSTTARSGDLAGSAVGQVFGEFRMLAGALQKNQLLRDHPESDRTPRPSGEAMKDGVLRARRACSRGEHFRRSDRNEHLKTENYDQNNPLTKVEEVVCSHNDTSASRLDIY